MAEYYKKAGSSTTSKAALGLGIAGTALGVGALGGGGVLGNLFAPRQVGFGYGAPVAPVASVDINGFPVYAGYSGCCGNQHVTEKEMGLIRELEKTGNENSVLRAEKYTTEQISLSLAPVYGMLNQQNQEICDLKAGLAMETERRACGDEKLLEYVKGNYIKAEKSINSKTINYHACKPVIEIDDCCCTSGDA